MWKVKEKKIKDCGCFDRRDKMIFYINVFKNNKLKLKITIDLINRKYF